MLIKGIELFDVQSGDVIMASSGREHKVNQAPGRVHNPGGASTELWIPGVIEADMNRIVGLVRRPWPKGKTKKEMKAAIVLFAGLVLTLRWTKLDASFDKAVANLREAIEAYELGKPKQK